MKDKILEIIGYKLPLQKLIKRGLRVGENFKPQPYCNIDSSHCWLISIGNNVTLAPRVQILAHDASTKIYLDYTKVGRVNIGNNVFVGAGSIILPNVTIGNNVIVGAGSIVSRDIKDNCVVAGNPARVICTLDKYISKNKELMKESPIYNEEYTILGGINKEKKDKMVEELSECIGYIK